MARPKQSFSLFKRKRAKTNKIIYYAKFQMPDGEMKVSTGCSSKAAAQVWAMEQLPKILEANKAKAKTTDKKSILFKDIAKGFWEKDGNYAKGRRARLRTISNGYLDSAKCVTENYLVPKWGKAKLGDLTPGIIDRWVIDLVELPQKNLRGKKEGTIRLAPATINRILQTFKIMLEQACSEGYLTDNPARYVKPVRNIYRKRGVLTPDEVKDLLKLETFDNDLRHYAINLLALSTGLRAGEVRGLQVNQIFPTHIEVRTSWEEQYGLKEPKWGSMRDIPIAQKVYEVLQEVIFQTRPQSIVFYGKDYDTPITKSHIEKRLYKAFKKIGITEDIRKEKNLTFHGHRHTLNTMMRSAGIHDAKIRLITGHRQEAMTERYTHFQLHDFSEVTTIQNGLI